MTYETTSPESSMGEVLCISLEGLSVIAREETPLDPQKALEAVVSAALDPHLSGWRSRTLQKPLWDNEISSALPCVTDSSYRAKEDPSKALLLGQAYTFLQSKGFQVAGGRWYVPNETVK